LSVGIRRADERKPRAAHRWQGIVGEIAAENGGQALTPRCSVAGEIGAAAARRSRTRSSSPVTVKASAG